MQKGNNLFPFIETSHKIVCQICDNTDILREFYDDQDACYEFYNLGWRNKKDIVSCPDCNKRQ